MDGTIDQGKLQRINEVIEELGGPAKAALKLGCSYAAVASIKYGDRNAGLKWKERFESTGISWDWIESGNAEKYLLHEQAFAEHLHYGNKRIIPQWYQIRFYPQRVNAGEGVPLDSQTTFFKTVDSTLLSEPDRAFCVFSVGESMTRNGIIDNSFLICEETNKDVKELVGRVVIASVDGVSVVKRLLYDQKTNQFTLKSESYTPHKDIEINESVEAHIQGVVLSVHNDIRDYPKKT